VNILKGVRPSDYLLTAVMVTLAVLLALMNMTASQDVAFAHPLESQSALMVPVFALAALPIYAGRASGRPAGTDRRSM
jgi:hypothetical protein